MFAISQKTPLLLALAVAFAMVGLTAWQGYQFWQAEAQPTRLESSTDNAIPTIPSTQVPQVNLASLSMFGSAAAAGEAADTNTENLPETNLRLSLRGVLAAEGEFPGSALIEDDKGKTEAYLVGNELPGNAKLRTVFPNRVIIERTGKLENLYFPEADEYAGVLMADTNEPDPEPVSASEPQPEAAPTTTRSPSAGEQQRREEIRQRLEQLRQRLQNNN
ncbi:MAG TPA: type II secretion system protein N [Marinobacter sp.]|nr:type II secretion system protein N [Marinobacter sp.]